MKKQFLDFLRQKGCCYEYCCNVYLGYELNYPEFTYDISPIEDTINTFHVRNWIMIPFDWISSPEGKDFWKKINNEWLAHYRTDELIDRMDGVDYSKGIEAERNKD